MPDNLRSQQQAWAQYIRDPSQPPPAGIEPERMALYRALCIGGIDGVLSGSFPRLRATLGESPWQRIVADFYATHRCATPLFPELGGEFLAWLLEEKEQGSHPTLPAWATELAHFEWTQQELLLADAIAPIDTAMSLTLDMPLRLSPLVRICGYRWPVDQLLTAADTMPAAPALLLLRRTKSHALRITALSAFEYSLLQAIAEQPRSMRRHLQGLALESSAAIDTATEQALTMLAHLQTDGLVQPVASPISIDIHGVAP
jgi:hypothetical protein